jgi:hypothetical protein
MADKLGVDEPSSTDVDDDDFFEGDLPPYLRGEGDEEYVDPELERLRPQINWLRPLLMVSIIAGAVYGLTLFESQLEYFLLDNEPIELGEIAEYPSHMAADPSWQPEIAHNRFVRATGVPTRFSAICAPPVRFFKLVGAQVYVELPMDEELSSIACHIETQSKRANIPDLEYFEGSGRAVAFERAGRQYTSLKTFYEREYSDRFCSSMTEAKKQARLKELRQVLREDVKRESGQYPDDATLEELVKREPICQNGFIIQAGVTPGSYWHYVLIYAVLIGIILWNIYALAAWARKVMPR